MRRIDLADPTCEPTDEEFAGLLHRAMDDSRLSRQQANDRLGQTIREERARLLATLEPLPRHPDFVGP